MAEIYPRLVYRRRLYQQIADDIERLILEGTFPHESRLPSEQELAERYGVSRNVIREALKSLKEKGLVSIRTGSGTYVRQPTTEPVSEALNRFVRHSLDEFSLAHFYEIRRMVEPESASLAAQRGTPEEIATIRQQLKAMEDNQHDSQAWSQADLDFHVAVTAATHNPLLHSILNALIEPLREVISAGHADPQGPLAGLQAHRQILESIETHNSEEAHRTMMEHLFDSEHRLVGLSLVNQPGDNFNAKEAAGNR
jgi:GntR family transcriptional repressor for pyruvate dehydrogenase complex